MVNGKVANTITGHSFMIVGASYGSLHSELCEKVGHLAQLTNYLFKQLLKIGGSAKLLGGWVDTDHSGAAGNVGQVFGELGCLLSCKQILLKGGKGEEGVQ